LTIIKKHVPFHQVEETAQEVFVRAYKALPTINQSGSLNAWFSTIAVRTGCDYWRRAYRNREQPLSSFTDDHREWMERIISLRSLDLFQEAHKQREARELLDWALDKLSPGDRMVMELVYLEGLSGKEAAELMGISVANVKIRAYRSRKRLRHILAGQTPAKGGKDHVAG